MITSRPNTQNPNAQSPKDQKPSTQQRFFYGRRIGKSPSVRQQILWDTALPHMLCNAERIKQPFPNQQWILEIGFGGGEHLLHQMYHMQNAHFIGVEPFKTGVIKVLGACAQNADLKKRLLLWPEAVQTLWPLLPTNLFSHIFILFPDPWPKKRHQKRQLVNADTVRACATYLKPGGQLCIATDDVTYAGHILDHLRQETMLTYQAGITDPLPDTWPVWPTSWLLTRYAQRGLRKGHPLAHFVWKKPCTAKNANKHNKESHTKPIT